MDTISNNNNNNNNTLLWKGGTGGIWRGERREVEKGSAHRREEKTGEVEKEKEKEKGKEEENEEEVEGITLLCTGGEKEKSNLGRVCPSLLQKASLRRRIARV